MIFQRTPIFLNYGEHSNSGHAYFPIDAETNYRRIMILSTKEDKKTQPENPTETIPDELFAVYDFHLPRLVRRMEPVRSSLKKNLTKGDFIYADDGVTPVKYKEGVVYVLETPVEVQEYSSTPLTDQEVVTQLRDYLESNLMPGQKRLIDITEVK